MYKNSMSTIKTCKKYRGRPRVESEAVQIRLRKDILKRIDGYATLKNVTRLNAIRLLLEGALSVKEKDE